MKRSFGFFGLAVFVTALLVSGCNAPAKEEGGKTAENQPAAATGTLTAQGSTFVQPLLSKVFDEYRKTSGFQINYTGGGSGQGVSSVIDGASFGASDAPMSDEELKSANREIKNLPITLGTVAIAYNIPGFEENGLKLDGPTIAKIFMGSITNWNDPAIAALNPGKTLPDQKIAVQVRADGSGTTYVLSDYLSKVDPTWKEKMGKSKKLDWGTHVQQWPKSDGVASNTKSNPGSITYVELTWAKKTGLNYAAVKNADGEFVLPDPAGATAAAEASAASMPADFRTSIVDAPGKASYPISSFVFVLVPADLSKDANSKQIVEAIRYLIGDGQQFSEGLDYAKLPTALVEKIKADVDKIKVAP